MHAWVTRGTEPSAAICSKNVRCSHVVFKLYHTVMSNGVDTHVRCTVGIRWDVVNTRDSDGAIRRKAIR